MPVSLIERNSWWWRWIAMRGKDAASSYRRQRRGLALQGAVEIDRD